MSKILNNKWLLGVIIMLILANAVFTVFLWTRMHHVRPDHHRSAPDRSAFIPTVLHFDSVQESQFKSISEHHFAKMDTLKAMEFLLLEKLYTTVDSTNLDTALMQNISTQLAMIQQQIHQQTLFHFRQIKAICRGEQLNKLKEMLQRSVMRDIGPARFLDAIPPAVRDSVLKAHPILDPESNETFHQHHKEDGVEDEEGFPSGPPPHKPGHPPHGRHDPNGPPPPPEYELP